MSLPEVTSQVGLRSSGYLARILEKHLGQSARQLRKKSLQRNDLLVF